MRAISAVVLLLAAVSCQKPFYAGTPRWMRTQDRYKYYTEAARGNTPADHEEERLPSVYVSALQFPDGVPWRDGDLSGAHIVLWKDGEEILDVPAGHYAEPDRHRVRDGHLWRDDSDGTTTYVYRDNELMLSYAGDEILRGLLYKDGRLYTLGQRAGGSGFSFRENGREVLSHSSAKVLGSFDDREWEGGALMWDGDEVCYSYALPILKEKGADWEYHVMRGEELARRIQAEEAETVYDIRVWNGSVFRTEQRNAGSSSLVLVKDDVALSLGIRDVETVHLCRLVPSEEDLLVRGYSTVSAQNGFSYWFRSEKGLVQQMECALPLAYLYPDNPERAAIYLDGGRVKTVWNGKSYPDIPPGQYILYTHACSALKDGILYAALSDASGNNHLLLQGEQMLPFCFNGCFTGIWIE